MLDVETRLLYQRCKLVNGPGVSGGYGVIERGDLAGCVEAECQAAVDPDAAAELGERNLDCLRLEVNQ